MVKTVSFESYDCALSKDFDLGDENNLLDDLNEYTQDPYENHAYNVNVPFWSSTGKFTTILNDTIVMAFILVFVIIVFVVIIITTM